jgi:hypothetical protein
MYLCMLEDVSLVVQCYCLFLPQRGLHAQILPDPLCCKKKNMMLEIKEEEDIYGKKRERNMIDYNDYQ